MTSSKFDQIKNRAKTMFSLLQVRFCNLALFFLQVAFIYVFNLIIGVGALTMPKAFEDAGWLMATILVFVLCFMRYKQSIKLIH